MSSECFTKDNLDTCLKELAKEFRRLNGKTMPAEITLVGGASILTNYGFRNMTTDIDAMILASSAMKDAISRVADKLNLPNGWLNSDFIHTGSYSPRLNEFSVYYKSFYNVLNVRTISSQYLIAMKLRSGRKYKNDLSDIIGILAEHEKNGSPITLEMISSAVTDLYGCWNDFPKDSKPFIESALKNGNYKKIYASVKDSETEAFNSLLDFQSTYPQSANESNVDDILKLLKSRRLGDTQNGK